MRRCKLLLRKVKGTSWPLETVFHHGSAYTLAGLFRDAGLEIEVSQDPCELPDHPRGFSFDLGELHDLMLCDLPTATSVFSTEGEPWRATGLIVPSIAYLSGTTVRRPQGVMFDVGAADRNRRPREGFAVAWRGVRESPRLFLRTLAHELGHVFNLLHPPEDIPPVYRGDSLMFETRDLARNRAFPENIAFEFSGLNRTWLTEAPEEFVRPGGAPFGSGPGRAAASPIAPTDSAVHVDPAHAVLEVRALADDWLPWEPFELEVTMTAGQSPAQPVLVDLDPAGGRLRVEFQTSETEWHQVPALVRECGHPGELLASGNPLIQTVRLPGLCLPHAGGCSIRVRYHDVWCGQPIRLLSNSPSIGVRQPKSDADELVSQALAGFDVRLAVCWRGGGRGLTTAGRKLARLARDVFLPERFPRLALTLAQRWLRPGTGPKHWDDAQHLLQRLGDHRLPEHLEGESELTRWQLNGRGVEDPAHRRRSVQSVVTESHSMNSDGSADRSLNSNRPNKRKPLLPIRLRRGVGKTCT